MSVEALWAVKFADVAGKQVRNVSGGVIVLETGRIFGGDTFTYYVGTYASNGDSTFELDVEVGVHFTAGGESIFGGPLRALHLKGVGKVDGEHQRMEASLHPTNLPALHLVAILERVAELP